MYKIKLEKLKKLIHEDKNILKRYTRFINEDLEREEACLKKLNQCKEAVTYQEQELANLHKNERDFEDEENRLNGQISFLEILKMFQERRLKFLLRDLNETNQEKFLPMIERCQKEIDEINQRQENCREQIDAITKRRKENTHRKRKVADYLLDAQRNHNTALQNYKEWEAEVDLKTERFYKGIMVDVTENYEPCKDIVVPFIEQDKKITHEEALLEANPILIENEVLLEKGKKRILLK